MKNLAFLLILLAVAAVSYGLGRRHGASAGGSVTVATAAPDAKGAEAASPPPITRRSGANRVSEPPKPSDPHLPFAQNMSSAERGYAAAQANLEEALSRIASLPVPERMGFVTGIFSFVARHHTPADALRVYQRVPEPFRPNALRALVGEWIYTRSSLDEDQRHIKREGTFTISGSRLGLEVELTSMLASAQPDAELVSAWLDAFANHGSRSEMLMSLAGRLGSGNPDDVLNRTEGWTPWEQERVTRSVLANWSQQAPQEAWQWYQANQHRIGQDLSSSILAPWAWSNPEAVKGLLDSTEPPAQRKAVIETLGKVLAEKDTDAAVNWANGLADAGERLIANQAVYDGAPRGIGAVLGFEKGFPTIRGIVPGSPLEGSGVQPGDRLLELWEANGAKQSLYARDLNTTANLIRGEPGSELTLRLLRQNKDSGQLEEHLVPVMRGQLYLNEKALSDRGGPAQGP